MPTMRMSDGCEIHYRFDGEEGRPVLVFSNPHGFTHALWDLQVEELTHHFQVLRYDNRGHGNSEVPEGPYTLERIALDAKELIEGLGLQGVAFCGLSIGGMVGMWLAAHAPHVLGRAVLANTSAWLNLSDHLRRRIAIIEEKGMTAVVDDIIGRSLSEAFRDDHSALAEKFQDMVGSMSPTGYIAGGHAVLDMDLRATLSDIALPVLVIAGAQDTSTPVRMGEVIAQSVAGARIAVLEAAHLSNVERVVEFNRLLVDFLDP